MKNTLENLGVTNISIEVLANNYIYKFDFNNKRYTLAHILNIYGESVDFWELYTPSNTVKEFNTLEQAINFLKENN